MSKLEIYLTKGSGEAETEMGAYCRALNKAGLINLNLICLSSVLPHNSRVLEKKPEYTVDDYGKKAYTILSEIRTSKKGRTICAGLGWVYVKGGSGNGMVVQVQGENEEQVRKDIEDSLLDIKKYRDEEFSDDFNIHIEEITCHDRPVSALVALAYGRAEGWESIY